LVQSHAKVDYTVGLIANLYKVKITNDVQKVIRPTLMMCQNYWHQWCVKKLNALNVILTYCTVFDKPLAFSFNLVPKQSIEKLI
jgi:hypothetical protein